MLSKNSLQDGSKGGEVVKGREQSQEQQEVGNHEEWLYLVERHVLCHSGSKVELLQTGGSLWGSLALEFQFFPLIEPGSATGSSSQDSLKCANGSTEESLCVEECWQDASPGPPPLSGHISAS